MNEKELVKLKYMLNVQVLKEILIKNGLTTREEFNELYTKRLEMQSLTDEEKQEISVQ